MIRRKMFALAALFLAAISAATIAVALAHTMRKSTVPALTSSAADGVRRFPAETPGRRPIVCPLAIAPICDRLDWLPE